MGYSEIHCHLCGVSFNIARIRTPKEPRSFAWEYHGTRHPSFVSAAEYAFVHDFCNDNAGCQIAFREDHVPYEADTVSCVYKKVLERFRILQSQQDTAKGHLESLSVEKEENESIDADFDSEESYPEYDDDGMDYEFEEPSEQCDEMSLEELTDCEAELVAEAIYKDWLIQTTQSNDTNVRMISETSKAQEDHEESQAIDRMARIMLTNPNTELMLPLYKQSTFNRGDYLAPEAFVRRSNSNSPPQRDFSFINHRLNIGQPSNLYELDEAEHWEHIAGADCTQPKGYNGTKISFEEMKCICTSQCLYETHNHGKENPLDHNEGQSHSERAPDFALSGLCFSMPSRDCDTPAYDGVEYAADNHIFRWDFQECAPAIPFHPACLEVYKRVYLKKGESVNLTQLGGWWRIVNIDYNAYYSIPRDEAVRRGREQWWQYKPGDEWLTANPCLIPELKRIIEGVTTDKATPVLEIDFDVHAASENANADCVNAFTNLPTDIHKIIFDMLPATDLANLSLGLPLLRPLINTMIRPALIFEYPYLWELWCNLEYPIEAGMSGIEHRSCTEAATPRNEEAQRISAILREDGFDDMADKVEEEHRQTEATLRHEDLAPVLANEIACVEGKDVDYIRLALALHKGLISDRIKGLRNRARIWKDCNWILGDIDRLKQEGKLLHNGEISYDTWQVIQDQSA